jgi:hypothetical protein
MGRNRFNFPVTQVIMAGVGTKTAMHAGVEIGRRPVSIFSGRTCKAFRISLGPRASIFTSRGSFLSVISVTGQASREG